MITIMGLHMMNMMSTNDVFVSKTLLVGIHVVFGSLLGFVLFNGH